MFAIITKLVPPTQTTGLRIEVRMNHEILYVNDPIGLQGFQLQFEALRQFLNHFNYQYKVTDFSFGMHDSGEITFVLTDNVVKLLDR